MTTQVRLATYNIAHGRGRRGRVDLGRTAAVLAGLDADVLCLQEVDRFYSARSGWADQSAVLAERLGMHVEYGAALTLASQRAGGSPRQYGNAVLARVPLHRAAVHPLPALGRVEPRALLLVDAGPLRVGCLHLQHDDPAARGRQLAAVLAAAATAGPLVLAGDLNAGPDDPELAALRRALTDVWPVAGRGRGATFPSRWPRRRLDQVYVSAGVRPERARVLAEDASDHRPLVVDLIVGGPADGQWK